MCRIQPVQVKLKDLCRHLIVQRFLSVMNGDKLLNDTLDDRAGKLLLFILCC